MKTEALEITGFGLAIKRVGVALGTALVLAVVVVVGTALPLVYDWNVAKGQAGFIVAGVVVACGGFTLIAQASAWKAVDQSEARETEHEAVVDYSISPSIDRKEDVVDDTMVSVKKHRLHGTVLQ